VLELAEIIPGVLVAVGVVLVFVMQSRQREEELLLEPPTHQHGADGEAGAD